MQDAAQAPERQTFRVLLTAEQAFPEFERQFLAARSEISLGFRIFDPWTKLHSDEAQAIGETWMDLIAHTLARGVRVSIVISDFDAVLRPKMHRQTWASIRALTAAGELSGRPELLDCHASMHPARVGVVPRLIFWPGTFFMVRGYAEEVNADPKADSDRVLSEVPFLRRQLRRIRNKLAARLWPVPVLVPVSHHQKLAVFDREMLYIGGLDLNDRRYDTPKHRQFAEQTWHDTQVLLSGPEAKDAWTHLHSFEAVTQGDKPPPKLPNLLRTISRRRRFGAFRMSPVPCVTELAAAHDAASSATEKLIYLETQFFRDRHFARTLARAARKNPELKVILILPAAPDDVAFENSDSGDARYGEYLQAKCVDILRKAFGNRIFIGSPAQQRPSNRDDRSQIYGAPLVYLHAKVSIFDDSTAIISSANLNGRSLRWDTEAGVRLNNNAEVAELKRASFRHWLGEEELDKRFFDTNTALEAGRDRARQNVRSQPEDRIGFILPYTSRPARRFGRRFPGIPEEMV